MALYDEDYKYPTSLYDPETGRQKQEAYMDLMDIETQEAILRAESIQNMRTSAGFKIIEKFLTEQVKLIRESLPHITHDKEKLFRLQEACKCYQNVLDYVDQQIQIGMFHKQRDNSK